MKLNQFKNRWFSWLLKWAKCVTYIGITRKFSWTPCQAGRNFGLDKAPHSLLRKSKARGMMVAQSYSSYPVKFSTFPVQDSYFQNILTVEFFMISCLWPLLPEHSTLLWSPCFLSMNFTSRTLYTVEVFMFPIHDPYFQSILPCWVPSNFLSTTLTCRIFSLFGNLYQNTWYKFKAK